MAWLQLPQLIVYLAGLGVCSVVAWRLMHGRFSARRTGLVGWALCPGALLGGLGIASFSTPDVNPIAILWLYLPFFAFAAWALYFSLLVQRGRDAWSAGRRALAWTVPTLLLAPLLIAVVIVVLTVLQPAPH